MKNLRNYRIVGHVHDELIIECKSGEELEHIRTVMGQPPPWLPGICLRADGYTCRCYQKDT